ncbi:MAG: PilZ domain-containing protein [Planctomycetaceae bacterium]
MSEAVVEIGEKLHNRKAMRVIDSLDRWAERLEGHHNQRRSFPRTSVRTQISIYIPNGRAFAGEGHDSASFQAWTRNISSNGVSFVYPQFVKLSKFIVSLDSSKGPLFFNAEIVRIREVHEDHWEYGARLLGRAAM